MNISIIIPFYEGNKYLPPLFKMIDKNVNKLYENYPTSKVEVILINDSPWIQINSLPQIEECYCVNVITNKKNLGIHQSRIKGLDNSKYDFILFLDQDDKISNDYLLTQVECLENADIVVSNGYIETSNNKSKVIYKTIKQQLRVKKLFYYLYLRNDIISPGQCLIRKLAIPNEWKEINFQYNGADDNFLWILMLKSKMKFSINNKPIYTHSYTGENTSLNQSLMNDSNLEMLHYLKNILSLNEYFILKRRLNFWMKSYSGKKSKYFYLDIILLRMLAKKGII